MSHIYQFKKCRDCISSLHQSAQSARQLPYRKAYHITLRYFFVRNRVFVAIKQKNDMDQTILYFLFLIQEKSAIPMYMFHLLPDNFPFVVPAFPHPRKSVNIATAFLQWFQHASSGPLPLPIYLFIDGND